MLDFSSLTGNEVALIEDLSGLSIDTLSAEGAPKAKLLGALVLVGKRRDGDKSFTINKAMNMTLPEMTEYLGLGEDAPDEDSEEGKDERSDESATE